MAACDEFPVNFFAIFHMFYCLFHDNSSLLEVLSDITDSLYFTNKW